jgi:hypothetical protein
MHALLATARMHKYRFDAPSFIRNELGVELWSGADLVDAYNITEHDLRYKYMHTVDGTAKSPVLPVSGQLEVAQAISLHSRVAVRSAFDMGKTFVLACLVAWWMCCAPPALVVVLAPTHRQISTQLWGELRTLFSRAKRPLGGNLLPKACQWDVDVNQRWQAFGFATRDTDNLQGYHQENLMVICDEAFGIARNLLKAVDDFDPSKWIMVGNPTDPVGYAGDVFNDPVMGEGWTRLTMSRELSPNVLAGRRVFPGICRSQKAAEALRKARGDRDNGDYRVGSRGQFVLHKAESIISWWEAQEAINRGYDVKHQGPVMFGLDLGYSESGDDNVLVSRHLDSRSQRTPIARPGRDHEELIWEVMDEMLQWDYVGLAFDCIGVGASFWTEARRILNDPGTEQKYIDVLNTFIPVAWGIPPTQADGALVDDDQQYLNRRAELHFRSVDWLVDDKGSLSDSTVGSQLSKIRRRYDRMDGRIAIERKEVFKAREGFSPNHSDAFVLSFEDPAVGIGSGGGPQILALKPRNYRAPYGG